MYKKIISIMLAACLALAGSQLHAQVQGGQYTGVKTIILNPEPSSVVYAGKTHVFLNGGTRVYASKPELLPVAEAFVEKCQGEEHFPHIVVTTKKAQSNVRLFIDKKHKEVQPGHFIFDSHNGKRVIIKAGDAEGAARALDFMLMMMRQNIEKDAVATEAYRSLVPCMIAKD